LDSCWNIPDYTHNPAPMEVLSEITVNVNDDQAAQYLLVG